MNVYIIPGLQKYTTQDQIIRKVCECFGITECDLKSRSKKETAVKARQIIMWAMMDRGYTPKDIAKVTGRDRTNTYHGQKVVEDLIETKDNKYYPVITNFLNPCHESGAQ